MKIRLGHAAVAALIALLSSAPVHAGGNGSPCSVRPDARPMAASVEDGAASRSAGPTVIEGGFSGAGDKAGANAAGPGSGGGLAPTGDDMAPLGPPRTLANADEVNNG